MTKISFQHFVEHTERRCLHGPFPPVRISRLPRVELCQPRETCLLCGVSKGSGFPFIALMDR